MIDLEVQRCTLRLHYRVQLKDVVEKVHYKCGFRILVVTKDKKTGAEDLVDIVEEQANTSCFEYPEEGSFVAKEKALIEPNTDMMERTNHSKQYPEQRLTQAYRSNMNVCMEALGTNCNLQPE
ncbi:unnamed protein product [Callosobruchus maculatus]|uniref:Uncharacterized protein n=1 Tax=Callosobruchus maculatus TaxID=64391 RepID=A0A653BW66_CALMS|nr:unnamed protein product [Callosobruchus maculatus]